MSQAAADQEVRANVHAMWAGVADRWAAHADYVDERGAPVTAAMLERAGLRDGDRVLELACGPGSVGLAAADHLGAAGEVVLSDVAPEMVAVAAARAEAAGLTNVRTATIDVEAIDEPDASFDVVLCREGLMFALDPARAVAEIHRVLRPGGRVAIAVWGPQGRNPWLGLVFDAVTAVTGFPVPPPGVPGPFALADAGEVSSILSGAGLADVVVEEVEAPVRADSFEAWWSRTTAMAGPLANLLGALPEDTTDAITDRLRAAVAPYMTGGTVELPGVTLLASAHRS